MTMRPSRRFVASPSSWMWARALYNNTTDCDGWDDVHLPDGWHLNARRVPMPPVPWQGRAIRGEVARLLALHSLDILVGPAYCFDPMLRATYDKVEWDP
jgi:hypothetical protein